MHTVLTLYRNSLPEPQAAAKEVPLHAELHRDCTAAGPWPVHSCTPQTMGTSVCAKFLEALTIRDSQALHKMLLFMSLDENPLPVFGALFSKAKKNVLELLFSPVSAFE